MMILSDLKTNARKGHFFTVHTKIYFSQFFYVTDGGEGVLGRSNPFFWKGWQRLWQRLQQRLCQSVRQRVWQSYGKNYGEGYGEGYAKAYAKDSGKGYDKGCGKVLGMATPLDPFTKAHGKGLVNPGSLCH